MVLRGVVSRQTLLYVAECRRDKTFHVQKMKVTKMMLLK